MEQLRYICLHEFEDLRAMKRGSFCQWICRAMSKAVYADRKKSITKKVPVNWKPLALQGAERVRKLFASKGVRYIINADETFLRFHEVSGRYIVPKGEEHVGIASKMSEKDGCTLMVSMEWRTSSLIMPFMIFNGGFGKRLMNQWKNHDKSTVLFTEKHWQTQYTMKIYLQALRLNFPKGSVIGLIVDKASSHMGSLQHWLEEENMKDPSGTKIILEYIDECLTSIYQPCDVLINHPLKQKLLGIYAKHAYNNRVKPGEQFKISRETLVGIVEQSYTELNEELFNKQTIKKSFERCGLNTYKDDFKFKEYLSQLENAKIYEVMSKCNNGIDL